MDIRHWCRYRFTAITFILITIANIGITANDEQQKNQRRDIASISATEINLNRNLRQAYDNNGLYHEIVPAQHSVINHYTDDSDYDVKPASTDNRKPAFYKCKDYAPSVKEEQPPNEFVIKVEAQDPDADDTITYSFEKSLSDRAKFKINAKTGDITTSYTFDRDEPIREKEVCCFFFFFFFNY